MMQAADFWNPDHRTKRGDSTARLTVHPSEQQMRRTSFVIKEGSVKLLNLRVFELSET